VARKKGFDDETELRPDPLRYRDASAIGRATITWRDASGPRSATVDRKMLVGSAPGADILLDDPAVSRLHAEIEPGREGIWLRDLGSRNGSFVEGILVGSARVPDGARVRLGETEFQVRYAIHANAPDVWPEPRFGPLVGPSTVMRQLFAKLHAIAQSQSPVLITGETGTGKELVARAIHEASPRREKPFVTVDCGALPEALLEAELFGHARGAFTGAVAARAGVFEEAEGGTIFLDEIGELPIGMQPKLLRVTEARTVRRVGESSHRAVDVRFIAATHRDLPSMVNAGAFREDLFFRLAVLPVEVPPLRAHLEDLPALVDRFMPSGVRAGVDPEMLRELATRPWLGNVRELRNFVERAIAVGARSALAMKSGERESVARVATSDVRAPLAVSLERPLRDQREEWLEHLEREYVRGILAAHRGNVSAAAEATGLNRTYLHRLIRKFNL
jgi:transcriptional regulator with GAF, ATPase, and Fis domain